MGFGIGIGMGIALTMVKQHHLRVAELKAEEIKRAEAEARRKRLEAEMRASEEAKKSYKRKFFGQLKH